MTTEQLKAQPAVMVMTLEIKRATTGKTETVKLVSIPEKSAEQDNPKEQ